MTDTDSPTGAAQTNLTSEEIAQVRGGEAALAEHDDEESQGQAPEETDDYAESQAEPAATALLETDEVDAMMQRWREIQAAFVDEPRRAVQDADALVADLMQRLARMFATERDRLESQWGEGDEVSTEDLRVALQRYRSFFQRLLAA